MTKFLGSVSNNLTAFILIVVAVLVVVVAVVVYFAFFHKKVLAKIATNKELKAQKKAQEDAEKSARNNYIGNVFGNRPAPPSASAAKVDSNAEKSVMGIVGKHEKTVVDPNKFKTDSRFAKEDQLSDSDVKSVLNISKHIEKKVEAKKQQDNNLSPIGDEGEVLGVLKRDEFNQKFDKSVLKKKDEVNAKPIGDANSVIGLMNNTALNQKVDVSNKNNEEVKPEGDAAQVENLMRNSQFNSGNK